MKTAFITGAAGGLGREVVKLFANNGYRVVATDKSSENIDLFSGFDEVEFYPLDITESEGIISLVQQLKLEGEGLDVLVCLAGMFETFPVTEAPPEYFNRMMRVNFLAAANAIQALLLPLIKKQGKVVVVSSESHRIQALFQPYMISKAALEAYCHTAWQELSLKGVSLSVIRPGAIKTPLLDWMNGSGNYEGSVYSREFKVSFENSKQLVGKIIAPEKVARMILKVSQSQNPKRVYRVNNSMLLRALSVLPANLRDRMIVSRIRSISRGIDKTLIL